MQTFAISESEAQLVLKSKRLDLRDITSSSRPYLESEDLYLNASSSSIAATTPLGSIINCVRISSTTIKASKKAAVKEYATRQSQLLNAHTAVRG